MLQFPGRGTVSPYFNDWKLLVLKQIEKDYDRRHTYLDGAMDYQRASVNEENYPMVPGNTVAAKNENARINDDRRRAWNQVDEINKSMDDERAKIFTFMLSKVSEASLSEMKAHTILWEAADTSMVIPGRKNPYLLLNLIRKVHMGESDGVNSDIYLTRARLISDLATMKKSQGEPMVSFKDRIINFKKSVDAQASIPIPINRADPAQGNHVVPIVEGGEVSYAEKIVAQYQDEYAEAVVAYRNDIIAQRRTAFSTIDEAYNFLASFVTDRKLVVKKTHVVRSEKRGRDSLFDRASEDEPAGPRKVNQKRSKNRSTPRDSSNISGNISGPDLRPCRTCVGEYRKKFLREPLEDDFKHFYPRDCPLASKDKAAKAEKPAERAEDEALNNSASPTDTETTAGKRRANVFSNHRLPIERKAEA